MEWEKCKCLIWPQCFQTAETEIEIEIEIEIEMETVDKDKQ